MLRRFLKLVEVEVGMWMIQGMLLWFWMVCQNVAWIWPPFHLLLACNHNDNVPLQGTPFHLLQMWGQKPGLCLIHVPARFWHRVRCLWPLLCSSQWSQWVVMLLFSWVVHPSCHQGLWSGVVVDGANVLFWAWKVYIQLRHLLCSWCGILPWAVIVPSLAGSSLHGISSIVWLFCWNTLMMVLFSLLEGRYTK